MDINEDIIMIKTLIKESPWKYIPVAFEPSSHEEHYCKDGKNGRYNITGARVRGKKHKHEGSNCDDWFEFETEGSWTFIAVSDGAGSKKFSRMGAKLSCRTAVEYLVKELKYYKVHKRKEWNEEVFEKNSAGEYVEKDIEFVQKSIHNAINEAYEALCKKTVELKNDYNYCNILERKPEIEDLSCTLLLAVHCIIKYNNSDYSLILTCQIGDGMTASIGDDGLSILGLADSGDFSGETDFLTSTEKLTGENLKEKTFAYFGKMKALMVMTDGVSDDYFPCDPDLLRLYGDLVINDIIDINHFSKEEINKALSEMGINPNLADYSNEGEKITEKGAEVIPVLSMEKYSQILGISALEIVSKPALLSAGKKESYFTRKEKPSERLLEFLDSYHIRGSFDDRTLVVIYMEAV
jgi:hypothetical protein